MSETINFKINISGNAYTGIAEIDKAMKTLSVTTKENLKLFDKLNQMSFKFNNISQNIQNISNGLQDAIQPGVALNSSLADLSAIAGVTGNKLKEIEGYARKTAKAFGVDAAQSVESYKLILSQLSPELGKHPEALRAMGDNIATLSKTMGGDATAAAEVLTTAMNQYGVSLDDPMEASRKMAEMMNVMAAAGKEGSAELPTIKSALEQCGMAAKAAGVSFEETNAAIQVLDKAGKKGSEGGVALRNTMAILSQGRFLPKDVQEELSMAGVDILKLGDKTLSLSDRLNMLKPVMNDTALFTKLFGRENANAAMALVQGTDEINRYTEAISGTKTAEEQAAVIMESFAERQARIQARFDDLRISLFNITGDLGLWVNVITQSLVPVSQLAPIVSLASQAISFCRTHLNNASLSFMLCGKNVNAFTVRMRAARIAGGGLSNSLMTALKSLLAFSTKGLASGVKALGKYILSLFAGSTASKAFATASKVGFASFKMSAVSACRAVGVAIMNIPIVGWIAAAVAGIIALINRLRKTKEPVEEVSDEFDEARSSMSSFYAQERSQLDMLFAKLKQTEPKSKERVNLVNQLKDAYPDLNEQILDEISNTNNLAGAYDAVITKIEQKARAKALEREQEKFYEKHMDTEMQISKMAEEMDVSMDEARRILAEELETFKEMYKSEIPSNDYGNVAAIAHTAPDYIKSFRNIYKYGFLDKLDDKASVQRLSDYFIGRNRNKEVTDMILSQSLSGGLTGGGLAESGTEIPSAVSSGAEAAVTGGTRNTQITINLGKMADVTFNGNIDDNADDMVKKLEELLLRVLYSAQNA